MPVVQHLSDLERGLVNRKGTSQIGVGAEGTQALSEKVASQTDTSRVLEREKLVSYAWGRWGNRVQEEFKKRAQRTANKDWKVSGVQITRFELPEAQVPMAAMGKARVEDIEVAATITYERTDKDQRTAPSDFNYTWETDVSTLGELRGQVGSTRLPVTTKGMDEQRNRQLNKEIQGEMLKTVRKQLAGSEEGEGVFKRGRIPELLKGKIAIAERRIATAQNNEDLRVGEEVIAELQLFGGFDEIEMELQSKLNDRFKQLNEWKVKAPESRPWSAVDRIRYLRTQAQKQMLGIEEEVILPPSGGGLSSSQRKSIEMKARQMAVEETPRNATLIAVEVDIEDRSSAGLLVVNQPNVNIRAHYREETNQRGIPAAFSLDWLVDAETLLSASQHE